MPNLKALSQRLKSVTSTAKITKAMKMVAASKLRGAETKMRAARPFVSSINDVMSSVLSPAEGDDAPESKALMAISSDKGLCGGVNSRVVKEVKLTYDKKPEVEPSLMLVGSKSRDALLRGYSNKIVTSIDEAYNVPTNFSLASFLAEQMLTTPADEYTILYNKFTSVVQFDVTPMTIKGPEVLGGSGVFDEYEFEGEKEDILANMYQFNLACAVYGCLLENITSEQASRMTAMDSATNNATDMISKLTIQYNRQRQAVITTELTEIVAGAESV
jgi:F-type H+-transporting ATPase subunit gamma